MNMITLKRQAILTAMAAGLAITALAPAAAADQPGAPVHIRGTVLAVTDTGFSVQTLAGIQNIAVADDTKITGVVPSSLDAIKSGTFIGTANVPGASGARALEVVVFPDSMKGTGLGDYAWDLPAKSGASSAMTSAMTNGTVKAMKHPAMSAMTNGTVKTSSGSGARTLVVDYGKGEKTINVPANVPVVSFQPADKTALVKGAHVFVVGKPGNPVGAGLVAVGLNGTVPPM
jgi:hypothetical protein